MYTAQAKMRLSCSARSSSSCLVRSFQKIFQQQRSVFVPFSQQHQSSLFIAAATRPGHQQQLAGSRPWRFSSTPRLIARSGDGEGATDSMEGMSVELEVKIEGMKCGGCSSRVEEALKAMDHVKAVAVDLESKLATVEVEADNYIDAMNMLPIFVTTINELGFEAEPHIEYQA
ncbi:hypothetical protein OEZ85_010314 [Tetradesmus obliquus]|uniref:HMA domain-containing protein n=1 Tax=Tetradesmus obliquus TaxID=3088 RepID=A0ABY8TM99_TETOB|nr:hypothetical protein OEZ85_010314 [Tetradesmus obliquus]